MNKVYPVYTTLEKKPNTICKKLDETVFEYPFFNEGVTFRQEKSKRSYNLKSVEIGVEDEFLEIKGLIFNASHCGSTLVCRILNQIQDVKVVSESEAINGLLLSKILYSIPDAEIKSQLRKIIRLYQQKCGLKRFLIIKLTSWNVYFVDLFLQLIPKTKWIYLDRETEDLLKSLMKSDGGFIDWWQHPVDELRKYFLDRSEDIKNKEEYLREMINGHRRHANNNKDGNSLFLKYPSFIKNCEEILNHFQLTATEKEIVDFKKMLKYDSKSLKKKLWKKL